LDTVLGPAEVLTTPAAAAKFVPGILAVGGVSNEDRDTWGAHVVQYEKKKKAQNL
jgi:hypothetical protein